MNNLQQKSEFDITDIITSFEDPKKIFEVQEQLGEGSYGSVYKALHKESGNIVALKIVPIAGEAESLKREISILKNCEDKHIIKYYGSYY